MQTPLTYYQAQISRLTILKKQHKQRRNGITLLKIILFLSAIYFIYTFADTGRTLYLILFVAAITLFVITNIFETKLLKTIQFLNKLEECAQLEVEYLARDFRHLPTGEEYKDQSHPYSHDLDIFGENSLFQSINRTVTPHGKEKLCHWLLHPLKSKESIIERQKAIAELAQNPAWCHVFRAQGNSQRITPMLTTQMKEWQQEQVGLPHWTLPFLYILPILTVSAWLLYICSILTTSIPVLLSCLSLFCSYLPAQKTLRTHLHLDEFTRSFSNLHTLIEHFSTLTCTSPKLQILHKQLFNETCHAGVALRSLHKIQESFDQRSNIVVAIFMNGLFMRELHLLQRLVVWKRKYAEAIPSWIEITGELDALVSLANYKYNHPDFINPTPVTDKLLQGTSIGHPLLPANGCVTNNFAVSHLHEFYIITGANMAGKSTFLRAIGVNLVLACCGAVVRAKNFEFQPMELFTSMRTVDNLSQGTSYFHAELLRLQQLVHLAQNEERLFIILDEILKGTNSKDKLNGSRRFLQKLLSLPVAGLVATHDLELGELANTKPDNFFNRCFEITHTDDDITYDYKLKLGISQNMNASILLEKMKLV